MNFEGKVAISTGAASGMGLLFAGQIGFWDCNAVNIFLIITVVFF